MTTMVPAAAAMCRLHAFVLLDPAPLVSMRPVVVEIIIKGAMDVGLIIGLAVGVAVDVGLHEIARYA